MMYFQVPEFVKYSVIGKCVAIGPMMSARAAKLTKNAGISRSALSLKKFNILFS